MGYVNFDATVFFSMRAPYDVWKLFPCLFPTCLHPGFLCFHPIFILVSFSFTIRTTGPTAAAMVLFSASGIFDTICKLAGIFSFFCVCAWLQTSESVCLLMQLKVLFLTCTAAEKPATKSSYAVFLSWWLSLYAWLVDTYATYLALVFASTLKLCIRKRENDISRFWHVSDTARFPYPKNT